jgi:AraC-like DNA-binding protein
MTSNSRPADVIGLLRNDVLLERYRYEPGPAVTLPWHTHDEYQLNLNLDLVAGVHYRGAFHAVPPGRLTVVMPGEPHAPRDPGEREEPSSHLVLYVEPAVVQAAAAMVAGKRQGFPAFTDLIVDDPRLIRRFVALHRVLEEQAARLEQDSSLLGVLAALVVRHARVEPLPQPEAPSAIKTVREYLHDNLDANVSLAELAGLSGLSPFRLVRQFRTTFGLPPHAYHVQLRVEHGKRLLLSGASVTEAGHAAGFFDTSHFDRHFRRHVGVAPGAYAGKNVHSRERRRP